MLLNNIFNTIELVLNNTGAIVYVIDLEDYKILYSNQACQKEFGNIVGKTCFKTLQKDENSPCDFCPIQKYDDPLSMPIGTSFEWENQNSINKKYYLFNDRVVSFKENKKIKIQVGIDITKRKALESDLLKERNNSISTFKTLLDSTIEGLIIYDEERICRQVNNVAPNLLGYTKDEMIGKNALFFIAPTSKELVKKCIEIKVKEPYEAYMLKKDGSEFPAVLRGHDLILNGEKIRVSAVLDITNIKKNEEKVFKLAYYDTLTGLPNIVSLKDSINMIINRNFNTYNYNALLFINLDNFKTVNDKLGRNIGDILLVEMSNRIKSVMSEADVVSRIGSDEFVVLIETKESSKNLVVMMLKNISNQILRSLQKHIK